MLDPPRVKRATPYGLEAGLVAALFGALTACGSGDVSGVPNSESVASGGGTVDLAGAGGFGGFGGASTTGSPSGEGGTGGQAALLPTCESSAKAGHYCANDKVANGVADTLYRCDGPGPASDATPCEHGCFVAAGSDDFCQLVLPACAHKAQLKYGLAPAASDQLRCIGITAGLITQTIGDAAASAGTHGKDGTIDGYAYSAATDLSVKTLTNAQVKVLINDLTTHGFAAFFRDPGKDGWPATEARHIHAIYVNVKMKASLQSQVSDWLTGLNGLVSHTKYTFYQASPAQKQLIKSLFDAKN